MPKLAVSILGASSIRQSCVADMHAKLACLHRSKLVLASMLQYAIHCISSISGMNVKTITYTLLL